MSGQFILGLLAGAFVSIPVGPFGIWAIHVYIREGWRGTLAVACGGMLGDIMVVLMYLGIGRLTEFAFAVNLEHVIRDFFAHGLVRGFTLFAVGIFLLVAASWEHRPKSNQTKFWISFWGAINPLNAPAIGFILSKFGVDDASQGGYFLPVMAGFILGGFFTWIMCMWGFSHLHFLRANVQFTVPILNIKFERSVLTTLLFAAGLVSFSIGIGIILQYA